MITPSGKVGSLGTSGPRILIVSASVGAGHTRAADAVTSALVAAGAQAKHVDIMSLAGPVFRRVYGKAYLDLAHKAPHLIGYFYDLTDSKPPAPKRDRLRSLAQRLALGEFRDVITEEAWDYIVCTHFLPADIISTLKRRKKCSVPFATVVTDLDAHALWANEPCNQYFVHTVDAQHSLTRWGVPPAHITLSGIPVDPAFQSSLSQSAARAFLREEGIPIKGDRPLMLLLSGGFGIGPIEQMYEAALASKHSLEMIVVCGRNESVRKRLDKIAVPPAHRSHVLGFTTHMRYLWTAADFAVSKPGGLTTSESLATGCPLIIVNPIPGQESRNADMLLEAGAALKANSLAGLAERISRLAANPSLRSRLSEASKALGRPEAANRIASWVMSRILDSTSDRR